ncbi:cbb3-type cytochrome oxidase assembly protein CcoS [Allopusillimonas ginsengisoli]|uniref:cbb3-type cytochrome oxidase assembly protein CcoS n=1 Tax=Allopusillimonas ginsengisoli TaxID=453575 RepID=UPI0010C18F7F|nr:cbb3-type cytochrome oxidase assembly protein CcoS [Allopusillimonas ginsengisoli]
MSSLFLLLPISLLLVIAIGAAFWWAIFAGQFDDAGSVGDLILEDDDRTAPVAPEPTEPAEP